MFEKRAPVDADAQLVVNQCVAQVQFYVDRQRAAGLTADEVAEARAALAAAIAEALGVRSPR
jgi:hypothetical protein